MAGRFYGPECQEKMINAFIQHNRCVTPIMDTVRYPHRNEV